MTIFKSAAELAATFEKEARVPSGDTFYTTEHETTKELVKNIHKAFDLGMPDDWFYETIYDALTFIGEQNDPAYLEDNAGFEFAARFESIGNYEMKKWYLDHDDADSWYEMFVSEGLVSAEVVRPPLEVIDSLIFWTARCIFNETLSFLKSYHLN